jgi:hypothetical protein
LTLAGPSAPTFTEPPEVPVRRILAAALVPLTALAACGGGSETAEVSDTVVPLTSTTTTSASDPGAPSDDGIEAQAGPPAVAAVLRSAPEAAAEAGTGRVDFSMEMEMPEIGTVTFGGAGAFDEAAGAMTMTVDMGAMLRQVAEATGEQLPPGLDDPMQVVIVGDVFYLSMPQLDQSDGRWITGSLDELTGTDLGMGSTSDPAAMLDSLGGVSDDVQEVGREQVRGVETTRYRASVDVMRALEELPPADRDRLAAQIGMFGDVPIPVEVWIDDDGLVRRFDMVYDDLLTAAAGESVSASMSMEFYAYGEPVEISPPPPGETVPIDEAPVAGWGG